MILFIISLVLLSGQSPSSLSHSSFFLLLVGLVFEHDINPYTTDINININMMKKQNPDPDPFNDGEAES
jgi:hypothetical protein